jgi:hypothetical protein
MSPGGVGADPHRLSNLLGLCKDCHTLAHQEPEWAREHGLMVSRHSRKGA